MESVTTATTILDDRKNCRRGIDKLYDFGKNLLQWFEIGNASNVIVGAYSYPDTNNYRAYLYVLTYYALGRKKESDAALRQLMMTYQSNAFEIASISATS